MRTSKGLRMAVVLGAIVVIGAAALSSGTVAAARGGSHGGGQTGGGGGQTLVATPNPVAVGVLFDVTGCGYGAGTSVMLNLYNSPVVSTSTATAGADGCIRTAFAAWYPGTATLYASTASGSKWSRVASVTIQVN